MEYDGSIRIGTGIDTKGFDEDGKKLEAKSRRLAENISDSSDVKIEVDTSDAKKEIKEVFDDIEKEEKFLLSIQKFYSGIRYDLPHETECRGTFQYMYLKYDGACHDLHDDLYVYGDG